MIETKLYLELGRESGPDVTMKHIRAFLAICVTPRFSGFTVYDTVRYWEGKPENSVILEILHDQGALEKNYIQNIARTYCYMFDRDCVLKVEREVFSELVGK